VGGQKAGSAGAVRVSFVLYFGVSTGRLASDMGLLLVIMHLPFAEDRYCTKLIF
jgi:hypothetical protein